MGAEEVEVGLMMEGAVEKGIGMVEGRFGNDDEESQAVNLTTFPLRIP